MHLSLSTLEGGEEVDIDTDLILLLGRPDAVGLIPGVGVDNIFRCAAEKDFIGLFSGIWLKLG